MHIMRVIDSAGLRVAAYCRVSTDKEDQRNSLETQKQFFLSYIQNHPDWVLVGIFADEGLSGTLARLRPQFTQMLHQALDGKIDLILTKEVSRFARNTVDTLQLTRQLKNQGVGVYFLNDNIDTRENDGEFRLTIMASVAQEESRKISERTRWGQLQAMRRGVVFGNNSLYGYILQGGKLTVNTQQAHIVQRIYEAFLIQRKGAYTIARELTEEKVSPPLRSEGAWSSAMILRILRNEKYCGDLLQKKYRTIDYLSHRKILNDGQEEQILFRDHHQAIVSRWMFQAVQDELKRRAEMLAAKEKFSARYWYSGKIRCGICGKSFTLKRTRRSNGEEYTRFVCRGRTDGGGHCDIRAIRGAVILTVARYVLGKLPLNGQAMIRRLMDEVKGQQMGQAGREGETECLRQAVQRQLSRKKRVLEAYLDGALSRADMQRLTAQCEEKVARLHSTLERLKEDGENTRREEKRRNELQSFLTRELSGGDILLDEVIQRIVVCPDCFLVEVAELPVRFRVCAEGRGTGENYHIEVTECTSVPLDNML